MSTMSSPQPRRVASSPGASSTTAKNGAAKRRKTRFWRGCPVCGRAAALVHHRRDEDSCSVACPACHTFTIALGAMLMLMDAPFCDVRWSRDLAERWLDHGASHITNADVVARREARDTVGSA